MRTVVRNSYTPQIGDYCNKIVIDEDKSVQYIFDSDGVFSVYTSKQQEGAPMFYVDSTVNAAKNELKAYADTKDAQVLQEAKDYADTHSGVSQTYVDTQDQVILTEAKAYTDAHAGEGGVSQDYVDQHDTATLSSAQSYADAKDTVTLSSAKSYTDTAVSNTLQNAKDYADGVGDTTLASANVAISTAIAQANVPVFTVSNVDISEGSALPANNFYGVYIEGSK